MTEEQIAERTEFQSTPPCGERPCGSLRKGSRRAHFNPRPHAGSDDTSYGAVLDDEEFQSTPPCGERRGSFSCTTRAEYISIHAPMRGATPFVAAPMALLKISIHAPMRGATLPGFQVQLSEKISIHAPMRGATIRFRSFQKSVIISIHAPMRGAT